MRALLWKDYRQNRRLLWAMGLFLLIPYLISVTIGVVERVKYYREQTGFVGISWGELLNIGSAWSLLLFVLACGCIGGNSVAGERVDRSSEFGGYLPISRGSAILSKAVVAIGACLVAVLINIAVAYITRSEASAFWAQRGPRVTEFLWFGGATSILIFGMSWLVSSLSNSPPIAAVSGIVATVLVVCALATIDYVNGAKEAVTLQRWYAASCFTMGIACFVLGIVYYLRRVEP